MRRDEGGERERSRAERFWDFVDRANPLKDYRRLSRHAHCPQCESRGTLREHDLRKEDGARVSAQAGAGPVEVGPEASVDGPESEREAESIHIECVDCGLRITETEYERWTTEQFRENQRQERADQRREEDRERAKNRRYRDTFERERQRDRSRGSERGETEGHDRTRDQKQDESKDKRRRSKDRDRSRGGRSR